MGQFGVGNLRTLSTTAGVTFRKGDGSSGGNVIIPCHTSGWTPHTPERQMAVFTENIRRYVAGLPLINVVDKKRGY